MPLDHREVFIFLRLGRERADHCREQILEGLAADYTGATPELLLLLKK
jgi:hypothetical protein